MLGATISVMGIYNYDKSIFNYAHYPEGIDSDKLNTYLMMETAEMECLYPDPNTLKWAIGVWCDKNNSKWERIYQTVNYTYNPFENYDMTEEYTRNPNLTHKLSPSGTDTTDSFVNGFNQGLVQNAQSKYSPGVTTIQNETGEDKYTKHTFGDASVRAVPEVIEKERQEKQFDFWEYILQDFMAEFCNLCYSL